MARLAWRRKETRQEHFGSRGRTERLPCEGEKRRKPGNRDDAFRASSPNMGRLTRVSTSSHDGVSHSASTSSSVFVSRDTTSSGENNNVKVRVAFTQSTFRPSLLDSSSICRLSARRAAIVCCELYKGVSPLQLVFHRTSSVSPRLRDLDETKKLLPSFPLQRAPRVSQLPALPTRSELQVGWSYAA